MSNNEQPPDRRRRAKGWALASAASVVSAAVIITMAATTVVQAQEAAERASTAAVISEESTAEDSPEARAAEPGAEAEAIERPVGIGMARDPLSNSEIAYARALIGAHEQFTSPTRTPVYLATVVAEPEAYDDEARRFEVTYYSYDSEELLRFVVNVTTGEIEVADAATGVQPPLSNSEVDEAYDLLLADPLSDYIKSAYLAFTGDELTSREQTTYVGSSFVATPSTIGGESCGQERCAMFLIQVPTGEYLPTTSLVVNLSQQQVIEIR